MTPRSWIRASIRLALAALLAAAAASHPTAAGAQAGGTTSRAVRGAPYLPLDDPAYVYLDALLARGALPRLSALERPYTTAQVRDALAELYPGRLGPAADAWARRLGGALERIDPRDPRAHEHEQRADDRPALRVSLLAIGTAETSARRELMRADDSSGMHPGIGGRATLAAGPLVAAVRLQGDRRLREDPDFAGSKARSITGRTEEAYVAAHWRYGTLFLGRSARNWGPSSMDGLQLGGYAYSWDHVAGTLGTERLRLTSLLARLDPYRAAPDTLYERHVAMHRVAVHLGDWEVAASEAVLYGGAGRGTELAYANPLALYQLAQYNEVGDGNVSYAADIAWRPGERGVYTAQLLVDDLQIDRCSPNCEEPASLGWTLAAEGVPLAGAQRAFASYTRVTNLTYRSPQPWEQWTSFGVGLGRGFSDYEEARVGLDLALLPVAPLRAYVAYRRQGEGDYRLPFPAVADYPTTPAFLAGLAERTVRVGATTALLVGRRGAVSADMGYNVVRDADHVAGRRRTGVEARVRGTFELASARVRP